MGDKTKKALSIYQNKKGYYILLFTPAHVEHQWLV